MTRPSRPSVAIIGLLRLYQRLISPLLGPHCRFYPSCSQYARQAFERRPFVAALGLTLRRLARCHPFHPGGYDPLEGDPDRVASPRARPSA